MKRLLFALLCIPSVLFAQSNFEDIPGRLSIPASQAVRRNAGDTAFEAFTPQNITVPLSLANGGLGQSGDATTNASTGNVNNLAFSTEIIRFSAATVTLTGLAAPSDAKRVLIYNAAASALNIRHQNTLSSASNRIITPTGTDYSLPPSTGAWLWYDTVTARWRFTGLILAVTSPLVLSATNNLSMPAATTSVNGYMLAAYVTAINTLTSGLSALSTTVSGLVANITWAKSGNNIYNTNTDAVWIASYACSDLVTYATCAAQVATGCSIVSGNDCADFNGDESSCNDNVGCSYSDPDCTGSYFSACSGVYRADDTSGAKVQVKATDSCAGTATACSSFPADASCTAQAGCTSNANTCSSYDGDETGCNDNGCSYVSASDCSDISPADSATCEAQGDGMTCTAGFGGDCSVYSGDEGTCTATEGCSWSDPDCSGSYYDSCSGTIAAYCSGDNSSCTGTATACLGLSSTPCSAQAGCTFALGAAIRAQGDIITTSATGTDKVVCIKSNGALGTCSAAVSGDSCTCS
jgi:hypothetical protein